MQTADRELEYGAWLIGAFFQGPERLENARKHLESGIAFYRNTPEAQGPSYLLGLTALAGILADRGTPQATQQELELLREAVQVADRIYGSESLDAARMRVRLAEAHSSKGRDLAAVELQREAFQTRVNILGEDFRPMEMLKAMAQLADRIAANKSAAQPTYEAALKMLGLMRLHMRDNEELEALEAEILLRLERYREAQVLSQETASQAGSDSARWSALMAILHHKLNQPALAGEALQQAESRLNQGSIEPDPKTLALVLEARQLIAPGR